MPKPNKSPGSTFVLAIHPAIPQQAMHVGANPAPNPSPTPGAGFGPNKIGPFQIPIPPFNLFQPVKPPFNWTLGGIPNPPPFPPIPTGAKPVGPGFFGNYPGNPFREVGPGFILQFPQLIAPPWSYEGPSQGTSPEANPSNNIPARFGVRPWTFGPPSASGGGGWAGNAPFSGWGGYSGGPGPAPDW